MKTSMVATSPFAHTVGAVTVTLGITDGDDAPARIDHHVPEKGVWF